jgi:hypothetical protein
MYQLRNETPSEQIRNSLDELTCRLEPNGDYRDHDVSDSVDSSTEPSHIGYGEEMISEQGHENGAVRVQHDGLTPQPSNVKHLFDIPQEQLPCPEDLQLDPNPTFPFEFGPEFGQGGDNAGIQAHVLFAMFILNFVVMLVT